MEHVAPVSGRSKMPLPACGLYLGSGVYNHTGRLVITGQAFTYWSPDYPTAAETVDLCVGAAQGNTLQFWQGGEELLALAKAAVARGLYVTCIYSSAPDEVAAQFRQFGDRYLGYDFGERFSMSVTHKDALSSKPPAEVTLKDLADNLMRKVSGHVAERKAKGWGPVMATSADFYLDYEVAAGTDIPVCEDYAFRCSSPRPSRAASTASTTCRSGARTWPTSGIPGYPTPTRSRCRSSAWGSTSST